MDHVGQLDGVGPDLNPGPPPLRGIAGMDVATRHHPGSLEQMIGDFFDIFRVGANDWVLAAGDLGGGPGNVRSVNTSVRTAIRAHAAELFLPSAVLGKLNQELLGGGSGAGEGQGCSVFCARLELDTCGAWVTLASAGYPRAIAVRKAGWVDIRGHVAAPLGSFGGTDLGDDRVGLGPGDALVICSDGIVGARGPTGDLFGEEALPELMLDCVGKPAAELADQVVAAALEFAGGRLGDDGLVMVIRVPEIAKSRALARVSEATGIPEAELRLPGYPAGDVQPDLWSHRPEPPHEARIRMTPEPPSVPALRRLLRRLLQSWRLEEVAGGDLELLATEVATRAFTRAASEVTIIVRYAGNVLRVEVDGGAEVGGPLQRRARGDDDFHAHGRLLLDALSSGWGIMAAPSGKRVWFEVPAGPAEEA